MTTKTKKHTTTLQIRLDLDLKLEAQEVFEAMGTNLTDGLKMYLNYIRLNKQIPFQPSTKTVIQKLQELPSVNISTEQEAEILSRLDDIKSGKSKLISVPKGQSISSFLDSLNG